jgi:DNA polymerase III epsilon subunit-like protein
MSADDEPASLTKHERKRLKKLRKKADKMDHALALSGIAAANELAELVQLERRDEKGQPRQHRRTKCYNVQLDWRNGKAQKSIGYASHRDLLSYLTDQVCHAAALSGHGSISGSATAAEKTKDHHQRKRKRKRGSIAAPVQAGQKKPPATFNWVSIHNKASLSQLCILEAHWRGEDELSLPGVVCRMERTFTNRGAKVVVVPTHWFQVSAKHPQDMTGALMYQPPTTATTQQQSKKLQYENIMTDDEWTDDDDASTTKILTDQILASKMLPLRLNSQQMRHESYPCGNIALDDTAAAAAATFGNDHRRMMPSRITQVEAEKYLSSKWVTAKSLASDTTLDYVMHRQSWAVRETGPMIFALDCEMLETTIGIELGRATLCQCEHYDTASGAMTTKLVFDAFVRPQNPVVDYKTQYSGLTAEIINDAANTVSLEQVQACVLQLVHPQDLLVGHSLENDLHAIRWIHPTVIDTAVLFRRKGRNISKCSLQLLARLLLKKHIQNPDRPHCSQEDAVTALELAIRRAVEGPRFDIASSPMMENWFTACSQNPSSHNATTFVGIGTNKWLQNNIVRSSTTAHAVVIGDTATIKTGSCIATACAKNAPFRAAWATFAADTIHSLETTIARVHTDFRGVLVVALQTGVDGAKAILEEKRRRQNPKATLRWTDADETRLGEAMRIARDGYVVYITQSPSADDNNDKTPPTTQSFGQDGSSSLQHATTWEAASRNPESR